MKGQHQRVHEDAAPLADRLLAVVLRCYRLKDEPRRGWLLQGLEHPESVAAHTWGTSLLCLLFAEQAGVDRGRALAIATVHDLAEAETGDIPARAQPSGLTVDAAEKARLEEAGLARLLRGDAGELRALWREYDAGASAEARFVRDMNLLDLALQALCYQERSGRDDGRPLPRRGGRGDLDEFFVSAETRTQGALARRLLGWVHERYRSAKARHA